MMIWSTLPTALWLLTSSILAPTNAEAFSHTWQGDHAGQQYPLLPPISKDDDGKETLGPTYHDFTLRHIYHRGTYLHPRLHRFLDIRPGAQVFIQEDGSGLRRASNLRVRSRPERIQRLVNRDADHVENLMEVGRMTGRPLKLPFSAWTLDDLPGPNVTDKETVLSFSKIAADAYVLEPHTGDWEDVGGGFNYTEDFGWENDGLRGHIFADTENKTVVIGLKGTSPAVFDGSETTTNDKINDNLFFSCCCGQGGQYRWKQVCDCQTSAFTCNSTCVSTALREKNRYYYAALDLYHNVTARYPGANVWLAGHSLGGAVSSLVSLTYGLPCVTFEAPAEAMAASRLGLPVPPDYNLTTHQQRQFTGGYHFGHTADPIYVGSCNTAFSGCTLAGYAMESLCHTGQRCVYDTVVDKGWRVALTNHRIKSVIHDVIQAYNETPECKPDYDCNDCYNWKFFNSNGSEPIVTTTSTTSSRTRTSICKTPGWWGCLDEPTSSDHTTTTTATTTTCKTPGWFGCKDSVTTTTCTTSGESTQSQTPRPAPTMTTTAHVTQTSARSSSSTTCRTPGWFGCNDVTSSTPISTGSSTQSTYTKTTSVVTCISRHWWGACREWDKEQRSGRVKLEMV